MVRGTLVAIALASSHPAFADEVIGYWNFNNAPRDPTNNFFNDPIPSASPRLGLSASDHAQAPLWVSTPNHGHMNALNGDPDGWGLSLHLDDDGVGVLFQLGSMVNHNGLHMSAAAYAPANVFRDVQVFEASSADGPWTKAGDLVSQPLDGWQLKSLDLGAALAGQSTPYVMLVPTDPSSGDAFMNVGFDNIQFVAVPSPAGGLVLFALIKRSRRGNGT